MYNLLKQQLITDKDHGLIMVNGAQNISHKPRQTDKRTDATKRIISPATNELVFLNFKNKAGFVISFTTCGSFTQVSKGFPRFP